MPGILCSLEGGWLGADEALFSADGKRILLSYGNDDLLRVVDAMDGKLLHSTHAVSRMWAADRSLTRLAGVNRGRLRIWDLASGHEVLTFQDAPGEPTVHLAFSPDGRFIASASQEGAIEIWDIASGKRLRRLPGKSVVYQELRYNSDGTRLLTIALPVERTPANLKPPAAKIDRKAGQ